MSLLLAFWLSLPFVPPKNTIWITRAEMEVICVRMESNKTWKPVAKVIRKDLPSWREAWVLVDTHAYFEWKKVR